jgi:hypothetical protein
MCISCKYFSPAATSEISKESLNQVRIVKVAMLASGSGGISGKASKNILRFPFSIHGETMQGHGSLSGETTEGKDVRVEHVGRRDELLRLLRV